MRTVPWYYSIARAAFTCSDFFQVGETFIILSLTICIHKDYNTFGDMDMSTGNSILGADRDFVIIRAAEGVSISQIQRELTDRGCDVSWGTVNKLVEDNLGEVEKTRGRMIRTGIGSYSSASHRMMQRNNIAKKLYEILSKVMDKAADCDSASLRDLKIVLALWDDMVERVREETITTDDEDHTDVVSDLVDKLEGDDRLSVIEELKTAIPGEVVSDE